MELRHLRYFVAVVRESSFTRAAEKLRVAQPALSRQIRQLEDEMGVRLLERTRRGVALTDAGAAFLEEAQAILAQSERAIRIAQKMDQGDAGQLELGYVWGLFHSLAPGAIGRFREILPAVPVHLFDLSATEQAEALLADQLDAGFIGFAHEAERAGLAKRKVASSRFMAALPAQHRAARQARLSLRSLRDDLFLTISERTYPGASRYVAEACAQAGFRPRILQAVERGYTILGLVAGNCGVALLPETLRRLPHPGVVFRPLESAPELDLFVAWRAGRRHAVRDTFLGLFDRDSA